MCVSQILWLPALSDCCTPPLLNPPPPLSQPLAHNHRKSLSSVTQTPTAEEGAHSNTLPQQGATDASAAIAVGGGRGRGDAHRCTSMVWFCLRNLSASWKQTGRKGRCVEYHPLVKPLQTWHILTRDNKNRIFFIYLFFNSLIFCRRNPQK